MKQSFILILTILSSVNSFGQNRDDAIVGKWLKIPKEDLIIEVYKYGNDYRGKITWAKDNDKKKPVGFVILDNLQYNSTSDTWDNGKIHDPNSGRTYNAILITTSDSTLDVNAYMGIKLLGTKKHFKKIKIE